MADGENGRMSETQHCPDSRFSTIGIRGRQPGWVGRKCVAIGDGHLTSKKIAWFSRSSAMVKVEYNTTSMSKLPDLEALNSMRSIIGHRQVSDMVNSVGASDQVILVDSLSEQLDWAGN